MAIKFGDSLENTNSNYPIVDATANHIAGIQYVADFTGTLSIPAAFHKKGTIVVDEGDGGVYVWTGADDSSDFNDTTNAGWVAIGTEGVDGGALTLGSTVTLNDNSPAISIDSTTTLASAIDQLNETLGSLVPTAPKTFTTQVNAGGEWSISTPSTNSNKVTNTSHTVNGLSALSAGTTVNWTTSTSVGLQTVTTVPSRDLKNTQFKAKLTASGLDDVVATLASDDADDTVTNSSLTLTKVLGDFPTSGDSQGFYDGVQSLAWQYSGTLSVGYHRLRITDDTANLDKLWYVESNALAAISVASKVLGTDLTAEQGASYYYSSGIKYVGNNSFTMNITGTVSNIVPSSAKIYGATANSPTDYNWAVGNAHGCFAAPSTQQYDAHPDVSSNTSVAPGLAAYSLDDDVSLRSNRGIFNLSSAANGPRYDFKSIHGNALNEDFTTSSTKYLLQFSNRTQSEANSIILEDNMQNAIAANGTRVAEPSGGYSDTPTGSFGTWSRQYANGSSSLDLNNKDAMVLPSGLAHVSGTNYGTSTYLPTDANNPNTSTGRTGDQYATFKFPLDTSNPAQKIKLFVSGTFNTIWVKTFDTGDAPAGYDLEGAASATNGWLSCHVTASAVNDNGVPTAGVADGVNNTLDGNETNREVTLTAGTSRFGYDGHLYVRVLLDSGDEITKLGLRTA